MLPLHVSTGILTSFKQAYYPDDIFKPMLIHMQYHKIYCQKNKTTVEETIEIENLQSPWSRLGMIAEDHPLALPEPAHSPLHQGWEVPWLDL